MFSKRIFLGMVLAFLMGFQAHAQDAEEVRIDMQIEIDGVVISRPHAVLSFGEKATITQNVNNNNTYTIEVVPTKKSGDKISLAFKIRKTVHDKKTLVASPKLVAGNHQTVSFDQKSQNMPMMKVSVTPSIAAAAPAEAIGTPENTAPNATAPEEPVAVPTPEANQ